MLKSPEAVNSTVTATSDVGVAKTLEQAIAEAITEARATCELSGINSSDCAVAWDIVEELQAEKSHRQQQPVTNSLERYCDEYPDALECRLYDA